MSSLTHNKEGLRSLASIFLTLWSLNLEFEERIFFFTMTISNWQVLTVRKMQQSFQSILDAFKLIRVLCKAGTDNAIICLMSWGGR